MSKELKVLLKQIQKPKRLEEQIHRCQGKHGLKYCSSECVDFMHCGLLSEFLKRSK